MNLQLFKRFYIFMVLFFVSNLSFSQDTLSIYFDFGSSKLKKSEQQKLDKIQENYYFENIQQVYFIGYSDSVGNVAENIRISEKRAATVYKYCKSILPENMVFLIEAKGESSLKRTAEASRRVDIIFDYKEIEDVAIVEAEITNDVPKLDSTFIGDTTIEIIPKEVCNYINYSFLHGSRQQIITNNGKEYVLIETNHKYIKKQKYYYQHYDKKSKKWEIKKVRWQTETTGQLWWRKQRINTKIELKDYNESKIFQRVAMDSCSSCHVENLKTYEEAKCVQVDSFLMFNAQYKINLRKGTVYMRVPREYVNVDADYYIGCGKTDKVHWAEKRFGKQKKYYFTTLSINPKTLHHSFITKEMDCCRENIISCNSFEIKGGQDGHTHYIVPVRNRFDFDMGTFYLPESYRPFIRLSYAKDFGRILPSSILKISTAITSDKQLFNKMEYNYYLYTFRLMSLNSRTSWSGYNDFTPKYKSRLFVGTSANSLHDLEGTNLFFSEAHFGINFEKIYPNYLTGAYFLSGASYNFSKMENRFGPYFELGISISLYSEYSRNMRRYRRR
jgi:hypothetical protein